MPTMRSNRQRLKTRDDDDGICSNVKKSVRVTNGRNGNKSSSNNSNQLTRSLLPLAFHIALQLSIVSVPAFANDEAASILPEQQPASSVENKRGANYWTTLNEGSEQERIQANAALLDYAVGTVNTMYYDVTGGSAFQPRDFYNFWRLWLQEEQAKLSSTTTTTMTGSSPSNHKHVLSTREGTVESLKWLIQEGLGDPYSMYLTRDELRAELTASNEGFLGLGAIVETPSAAIRTFLYGPTQQPNPALSVVATSGSTRLLTSEEVQKLPVVLAVAPDSPAERAGLIVGDRIVAVGEDSFAGLDSTLLSIKFVQKYRADNYLGHPTLTVAKPVYAQHSYDSISTPLNLAVSSFEKSSDSRNDESLRPPFVLGDIIYGYRPTRVRLPTVAAEPFRYVDMSEKGVGRLDRATVKGGDTVVHYELLTAQSSIFDLRAGEIHDRGDVGYIRLTRFSRASTDGFLRAVNALEDAGAAAYIIDLRNNYGGVIQEAMLTAATLLRDPHLVLCYTMNSRGGFTPHDVEEYVVDNRYPGYLLSREPRSSTLQQVKRENPHLLEACGWSPMSSYASLHEQQVRRGVRRPDFSYDAALSNVPMRDYSRSSLSPRQQMAAQKNMVILINEGTASSAEVFAAALHDNGRAVALVGTKTYGKGLVQHTFPLQDGGGLRLTVAEYLTPALQHVSLVGNAQYDQASGDWIGGGIHPDVKCDSRQGVPNNIGADLCVGIALDVLDEAHGGNGRTEGSNDRMYGRRPISVGVVKVS